MSYILEALKKLEEKRKKEEAPLGLLADRRDFSAGNGRRRPLPYFLAAALLLNAGLFLWWLHPWQQTRTGTQVERSRESAASAVPSTAAAWGQRDDKMELTTNAADGPSSSAVKQEKEIHKAAPFPAAETDESQAGAVPKNKIAGREQKVYALNDLPASVRLGLPDIAVSGLFYANDPSSRIVVIDGRTMHEGQMAAGGLRLEQITPDGVVLSFQGYKFRKGVF